MTRFLALTLCFLTLAAGAAAEPVYPPGSRVGLEPAPGLQLSANQPGFEDAARQVLVGILDLPAHTYEQIMQSVFAPEQKGLTGVKRESFAFGSGLGYLLTAQAREKGVTEHRYFLLATAVTGNDRDLVALIRVVVPDAARKTYSDAVVRKMLSTVVFRQISIEDQLRRLPFQVQDLGGFRVLRVLREGGVILIDGPGDDMRKQAAMIISAAPGTAERPEDRERFAREMLGSAPLRDITGTFSEPMRLNNRPAHEIRAQAESLTGDPLSVVQWVRFGVTSYLRIVGTAPREQWDTMFPRFRAVRDGVKF